MPETPLSRWLARLEQLHPSEIDLGLDRVRSVAERMDLLPLPAPAVIVAGTNGKGTTVAALETLAQDLGLRTGASTSPHFLRFNERIRVAGEEVGDEEIVAAFEAIDAARGETSLTYFEFGVLAALEVFRRADVSLYLLEVGLGGRLDAVNIVDADVAIITSIALDHEGWLGSDRGLIGVEKVGVARRDRPLVVAEPDPPEAMLQAIEAIGAKALFLGTDFEWQGEPTQSWQVVLADGRRYDALPPTALHPGNLAAALQALSLLENAVDADRLRVHVESLAVTGRRQQMGVDDRDYLLDVAHNPAALAELLAFLGKHPVPGRTLALFGVMSDKDVHAMIALAADSIDAWFLADIPGIARAASAADLADDLRAAGVAMISTSRNPRQALRRAQSVMSPGDRLVVFGSFHTVAGVIPSLEKDLDRDTKDDLDKAEA